MGVKPKTLEQRINADITVFPATGIAASACSGNGIIFDIADPRKPKRIDDVLDKGFAYWHSATFNNDGDKVIFTDEWGGGGRARCRTHDPLTWGADAIYDIVDGKLEFRSHFKMPAPQTDEKIALHTMVQLYRFLEGTSFSKLGTKAAYRFLTSRIRVILKK